MTKEGLKMYLWKERESLVKWAEMKGFKPEKEEEIDEVFLTEVYSRMCAEQAIRQISGYTIPIIQMPFSCGYDMEVGDNYESVDAKFRVEYDSKRFPTDDVSKNKLPKCKYILYGFLPDGVVRFYKNSSIIKKDIPINTNNCSMKPTRKVQNTLNGFDKRSALWTTTLKNLPDWDSVI